MSTEVINIREQESGHILKGKASIFFYGDEVNPFLALSALQYYCGEINSSGE